MQSIIKLKLVYLFMTMNHSLFSIEDVSALRDAWCNNNSSSCSSVVDVATSMKNNFVDNPTSVIATTTSSNAAKADLSADNIHDSFAYDDDNLINYDGELQLTITVIRARELIDKGTLFDAQDPMLRVQLGSSVYETERQKDRYKKKTMNYEKINKL